MRQLLFFSNNKNKTIEIKKIFKKFNLRILSLSDVGMSYEPKENGQTFEENAKIKSDYGFNKTGFPCFADAGRRPGLTDPEALSFNADWRVFLPPLHQPV